MRSFKIYINLIVIVVFGLTWGGLAKAVQKFAAIEIGGSNVKYVRLNVDIQGGDVQLEKLGDLEVENPGLAADLGNDGKGNFAVKPIGDAAEIVANFVKQLTHESGVPPDHIAIIGSSGLANADNRQELVDAVREATGQTMDFVNAENEVRFTLFGVVPDKELFSAGLVDIGSSNTKWGHLRPANNDAKYSMAWAQIPSGSKNLASSIAEQVGSFAETTVFDQEAKQARTRIKKKLSEDNPDAAMNQKKVYLSGGAVWAMVTLIKPETALDSYVRLTAADFRRYDRHLTLSAKKLFTVDYTKTSPEAQQRAKDDFQTVHKIFPREQIVSGGQILLAFAEEFGWNDPKTDKEILFARQGYKAWINGYVEEFARQKLKIPPPPLDAPPQLAAEVPLRREWTDRKISATLVGYKAGNVRLEIMAGRVYQVPLERLSTSDLRFLLDSSKNAPTNLGKSFPQLRTWTDGSGRTMEAALVSKQDDRIRVIRKDGRLFTMSAKLLSPADQEFLAISD